MCAFLNSPYLLFNRLKMLPVCCYNNATDEDVYYCTISMVLLVGERTLKYKRNTAKLISTNLFTSKYKHDCYL
jgi:hypothetical protein